MSESMNNARAAFEFDGTVNTFESGWSPTGPTHIPDAPFEGSLELIARLIDAGVSVYIVSERVGVENGVFAMRSWFATHGLSMFTINSLKFVRARPAGVSVFDRFAFGFPGWLPEFEKIVPQAGLFTPPHDLQIVRSLTAALTLAARYLDQAVADIGAEG
jgi:hypothetical protein